MTDEWWVSVKGGDSGKKDTIHPQLELLGNPHGGDGALFVLEPEQKEIQ